MLERNEKGGPGVPAAFDAVYPQQLLVYASELGEQVRKERRLRQVLVERDLQIHEVVAASIAAGEEEREWISCEIHDRIAQTLASVFQQLQIVQSLIPGHPHARQAAARASALLREAIRETRTIMNDLHPPILDELGAAPLIREELHQFHEATGCRTRLYIDYPVRPFRDVEVVLYRIFHEALANVRKHAPAAGTVIVTLKSGKGVASLRLRDDGPGFDSDAVARAGRVGGLLSMRRRAEILGGAFDVTSVAGRGTRITVDIPLNADKRKWTQSR